MAGIEIASTSIEYPVAPLEELYEKHPSQDELAQVAASQLVQSLIKFGVSRQSIEDSFTEALRPQPHTFQVPVVEASLPKERQAAIASRSAKLAHTSPHNRHK